MAETTFVSRGGLKLDAALDAFGLDVAGFTCVDLGCNVGGFTDCLLHRGAAKVHAVDTGYGALAWKLRNDPRVVVMERTNAMHVDPAEAPVDLAVIDLGWTVQRHALPAAMRWQPRQIVTLIKPHYEASAEGGAQRRGKAIVLEEAEAETTLRRVLEEIESMGMHVVQHIRSPIAGGAGKGKRGNIEYLALVRGG